MHRYLIVVLLCLKQYTSASIESNSNFGSPSVTNFQKPFSKKLLEHQTTINALFLRNMNTKKNLRLRTNPEQKHLASSSKKGVTSRGGGELTTFAKVRQTIFPIYGKNEVKKFLLLGSIKFSIITALTLTRDLKDTLIVTQCGAEAISFLKIYGVLPSAAVFIALYSHMASIFDKKTLFYVTCIPFFVFFLLFDLVIYPNAKMIQPSESLVQSFLGVGGGVDVVSMIIQNWTSALYYVVAEIYSSVSIGLLFWQFANEVVPVSQAKRFYPLFAQMSALAPIFSGQYSVRYASKAENFASSLHRLTLAISVAGIFTCVLYHYSNKFLESSIFQKSPLDLDDRVVTPKKTTKPKMNMAESAKFLYSSQYLRLIGVLVLGYGLSINFTEVMWKSLLKKQYPNALDYQRFIGNFSSAVGLATCIVIFFGVHVIRILGWRVGAVATPLIMAGLAAPFFTLILIGVDSPRRLAIAVAFGTAQSLVSKTAKYALFDPTTQMAYIPLDDVSKVKGKAAIDVFGSRVGKSGGSLIQQGLVFIFGNILNAAPAVATLFYSVLFAWFTAANKLSRLFYEKTEKSSKESNGMSKEE